MKDKRATGTIRERTKETGGQKAFEKTQTRLVRVMAIRTR
jgi:hypothetical protein